MLKTNTRAKGKMILRPASFTIFYWRSYEKTIKNKKLKKSSFLYFSSEIEKEFL